MNEYLFYWFIFEFQFVWVVFMIGILEKSNPNEFRYTKGWQGAFIGKLLGLMTTPFGLIFKHPLNTAMQFFTIALISGTLSGWIMTNYTILRNSEDNNKWKFYLYYATFIIVTIVIPTVINIITSTPNSTTEATVNSTIGNKVNITFADRTTRLITG